jgi:hypothetical protein
LRERERERERESNNHANLDWTAINEVQLCLATLFISKLKIQEAKILRLKYYPKKETEIQDQKITFLSANQVEI